ncbi:hypothetical protein [Streptomyces iakyrus]
MHSPEADASVEELRAALAAHGITLPSLGIDPRPSPPAAPRGR